MKRVTNQIAILLAIGVGVSALGIPVSQAATKKKKTSARSVEAKDSSGTIVKLSKPALRVVCLTGICVDTLRTVGLKPVAATDKLHLNPLFYGDSGKDIATIGGSFFEPSLEDIVAAKPDLIIGLSGVHEGLRKGLAKVAPLYISGPIGLEGMYTQTLNIGKLVGKEREVSAANASLKKRVTELAAKVPEADRKTIVVIYGSDANIGASTLDEPPIDALSKVTAYGFTQRPTADSFPKFTLEDLLKLNPDAIFVTTAGFGPTPPTPVSEQLAANPIWSQLKAVKAKTVYEVSFDVWGTTRGIRGTNAVLDEAVKRLYPNL